MDAFDVLADPTRRQLLEILARGDRSVGELAEAFDFSQPAISQHLRKLREAGLVRAKKSAQKHIYHLNPEGLQTAAEWLKQLEEFWGKRMEALERELRNEAPREGGGRKR